ncbi:unnamed protein product [Polarella glacialis]|uniref:Protein ZIP4 homolog n=1 Tax=Polarella glacialis TaxID=89957 RepID=A0A813H7R4_POLGL|nr:unnamed protein product [Polarella glacialis]
MAALVEHNISEGFDTALEKLISTAEAAVGQGHPVELDPAAISLVQGLPKTSQVSPLTFKRAGHRLWQVCSAASSARPPLLPLKAPGGAAARELACELIETGMAQTGSWPASDQFDLILQWAVSGKAWLDLGLHAKALHCLTRSAAAWDSYLLSDGRAAQKASEAESQSERLAEASLQTQLWMATCLTHTGGHDQALVALSKAAGILRESRAVLAAASRGLVLRACREQAAFLCEHGRHRLAADVLELACAVLEDDGAAPPGQEDQSELPAARPERAELLRQLAGCYTELLDSLAAASQAREAVRLEHAGSSGHARSLKALVLALCVGTPAVFSARGLQAEAVGENAKARLPLGKPRGQKTSELCAEGGADGSESGQEVSQVALELVSHKRSKLQDCIEACRKLADGGWETVCSKCLEVLRKRLHADLEGLATVWLFGAQMLAGRIEESAGANEATLDASEGCSKLSDTAHNAPGSSFNEATSDRLCALLDEVEAAPERSAATTALLAELLWNLAEALSRKGRPQDAVLWLQRALPFLGDEGQTAAGWRALAACHSAAGEADRARCCADTALAHDPTDVHAASMVLLDAVKRGDDTIASELIGRVSRSELKLGVAEVSFVLGEASGCAASLVRLECLNLLAHLVSENPDASAELSVSAASVHRLILEEAEALGEHPRALCTRLAAVASLAGLAEEEVPWFLNFAWLKGSAMVDSKDWMSSALLFERAHEFLGHLTGVSRCNDASGTLSVGVDAARCSGAVAQALLQQAHQEEKAGDMEAAVQLRKRALSWAERGKAALSSFGATGEGGSTAHEDPDAVKAYRFLLRQQFEAACFLSRASHGSACSAASDGPTVELLGCVQRELLSFSSAAGDATEALSLARLALEAGHRELATAGLWTYLKMLPRTSIPGKSEAAAAARREMVSVSLGLDPGVVGAVDISIKQPMQLRHDVLDSTCEDALAVLRSLPQSLAESQSRSREIPPELPESEVLWLVAMSWNMGTDLLASSLCPGGRAAADGAGAQCLRRAVDLLAEAANSVGGLCSLQCAAPADDRAGLLQRLHVRLKAAQQLVVS